MKGFGWFKKLFSRDKDVVYSQLMRLRDTVHIRSRNELRDNELEMLEEYKKSIQDKLNSKVLFSGDLDIDYFKQEMDMYIELVVNLFLKEDSVFDNIDNYSEKLNLIVKAKKKDLYLQNILDIIETIEIRIIALEEILNEISIFNTIKRRAVSNKLDELLVLANVFQTQGEAIFIDANANIRMADTLEEDTSLVRSKLVMLEEMFRVMLPNKVVHYNSESSPSDIDKIARIERELEIRVYKHKDIIKYIEEGLESYSYNGSNGTLKDFRELELRVRVFSDYGRDLVSDELIKKLYRIKFGIITKDLIHDYSEMRFKNLNYVELEQYKEIIFEKISNILTGKNQVLSNLLGSEYGVYVKLIVNVLKDGEKEYDWYKILSSKFLLSFLISLESEKGILEFFRFTKDKKEKYGPFFDNEVFSLESEITLESIFEVSSIENSLSKLYEKLFVPIREKYDYPNVYHMPEGIVSIDCTKSKTSDLLEKIRSLSEGKIVYTPLTLKRVNGDIFGGHQFALLKLNEGLEELFNFPAEDYKGMRNMYVPSTLEKVSELRWKRSKINETSLLTFYYYTYPVTKFTYSKVKNLVFENFNFDRPSPASKFILGLFFHVTYNKFDGEYEVNLSNNGTGGFRRIATTLDSIVFEDKFDERLEINKCDLKNLVVSTSLHSYNGESLTAHELENLLQYLISKKLENREEYGKNLRL